MYNNFQLSIINFQFGEQVMPTEMQTKSGLTGNQLKILAMIAMTCDHVGLQLLPQFGVLRIIGRLALPIYAYMIAEGCRYTRDRKKYLLRMLALAATCQVVYFGAMGSLYQCILVTFSLSICLIYAVDNAQKRRDTVSELLALGALTAAFVICVVLPDLLPHTDFAVDYGIWGVLLPVLVYFGKSKPLTLTAGLVLLALNYGGNQWWALAAVPLLMCYNGQRGKYAIGKLFYIYYPAHLVVIYGLSLVI